MRLLIDTNVLIPLEPTRAEDLKDDTPAAALLIRRCNEGGHTVHVHPRVLEDLARDKDDERRTTRVALLAKYPPLPNPPGLAGVESVVGAVDPTSNHWVDHHLLAAVLADAVGLLVTNDDRIHKKAARLGVASRVYTLNDAISALERLSDRTPSPPPAVRATVAHELDAKDPILDSLRADYAPDFDDWLARAKRNQRLTWIVSAGPEPTPVAGFCLVKQEEHPSDAFGLTGKVLKLCTFKVGDRYFGNRFGELLLKPVFDYCTENTYDWAFVTVFARHEHLVRLFNEFGFADIGARTARGELVLAKPMRPTSEDRRDGVLDPLAFNRRFGPRELVIARGAPAAVVPIQPRYHARLFPECETQTELFPGREAFGNSIRKAYLCHASYRQLASGSCLLFYRSQDHQAVHVLGVVEETRVSENADEIVSYVARRTVYTEQEIRTMAAEGPVLSILFRFARRLLPPIQLAEALDVGILQGPPQSIQAVPDEGIQWLENRVRASRS